MQYDIDLLDKKILLELDRNSRQSFSQLGRKLKTSKGVISYRVRQLEKKKIIRGYYTVVDTARLGYYSFRAYIKLREASKSEKARIINYLVRSRRTWWVSATSFPYDIAAIFLARSLHDFNGIFKEFLKSFKGKLRSYDVKPYVEIEHFFRDYILSDAPVENRKFMRVGEEVRASLDSQELELLEELSVNSRAGTVTLAKKLGMSPTTAKNIIRKLQKEGIIKGFRLLFDYSLLGYDYYWVHIDVSSYEGGQKLTNFVRMFPETVYLAETIGGNDLEFGMQVKAEKGIQALLMEIFERFDGIITDYTYFKVLENKKVSYMPGE